MKRLNRVNGLTVGCFLAATFVVVACASAPSNSTTATTATTTGAGVGVVTGRVTAGPTCPVERIDHPCPPSAVIARVQARAGARVVASTETKADGTYRLELPVGPYSIVAATQRALPRCTPRFVNVTPGRQARGTDILCDTGIR